MKFVRSQFPQAGWNFLSQFPTPHLKGRLFPQLQFMECLPLALAFLAHLTAAFQSLLV